MKYKVLKPVYLSCGKVWIGNTIETSKNYLYTRWWIKYYIDDLIAWWFIKEVKPKFLIWQKVKTNTWTYSYITWMYYNEAFEEYRYFIAIRSDAYSEEDLDEITDEELSYFLI